MGRGGYLGGSTIIGPGRAWYCEPVAKKKKPTQAPSKKPPKAHAAKPNAKTASSKQKKNKFAPSPRGAGLTIPEMINRDERRVADIQMEGVRLRRRLGEIERQLALAKAALEKSRATPRRSSIGIELEKIEREKLQST